MENRYLLIILAAFILVFSSCKKKIEDLNSQQAEFAEYVSYHTSGAISKKSAIRIRFKNSVDPSLINKTKFCSFSPSIEGDEFWEDQYTLVFQPKNYFKSGETYLVSVNLGGLIPGIPDDKKNYNFSVLIINQDFEVKIDGIKYEDPNNLKSAIINGRLFSADDLNLDELKSISSATQNNKDLAISWSETNEQNTYSFNIAGVVRSDLESKVDISFDGNGIGLDKKLDFSYQIPSLDDFKVLSTRLVTTEEKYISVIFSDPLLAGQDLKGLVAIPNESDPRLVILDNELKVYPVSSIIGKSKFTIYRSIKNSAGFSLKSDYEEEFQFEMLKPELKFGSGMSKSIIPSTNGLQVPFMAVGLKEVELSITKIFSNNTLQYFQSNRLGGKSQMNRVGRIILKTNIPLTSKKLLNLQEWNTFSINLKDYINPEPGCFYQVELGFNQQQSIYPCDSSQTQEEVQIETWGGDYYDEEYEYYDDYSSNYYSPNFNWEERDNPCNHSYYGGRRSVDKLLYSSDLGLIVKKGAADSLTLFVTNIITTDPVQDAKISVYDFQNQIIGEGSTDSEGKLSIAPSGIPYLVMAQKDKDFNYLRIDDGSSLSLSNFDVSGDIIQKGFKGFIYGERGVWRPGDTIHLGFILDHSLEKMPKNHPVIAELYNPANQLYSRKVISDPVGNIYRIDLLTEKNDPTGNWWVKINVGGADFTKYLRIETVKPNRLKVDLNFDKTVFTEADDFITGHLNVRWLSGGIAGNLKTQYDIKYSPTKTTFKDYPDYSFDDLSKRFYSERESVFEGRINSEGKLDINFDLSKIKNTPGAVKVNFYGTVFEEGGDPSIRSTSIEYYPYKSFVGLKAPTGNKQGILETDKNHEIRIVTVDANGKSIERKHLKIDVYRVNWRWWWDRSEDNVNNYLNNGYQKPIETTLVSTVNGQATFNFKIKYPDWGRYFIRVSDPVSGHSAGNSVKIDWPEWQAKGNRGDLDGASMLDFGLNKTEFNVNEEVKITVPSTEGNRILVSLETGSKILRTFWVKTEKEQTLISFKALENMSPNAYAHLTMIQPHGQNKNDLPIRLYGVQSLKVSDPNTVLEPIVKMPAVLQPEEQFEITISEKNNRSMAYTVAVVDEGLLDISNFKTPDPWSKFYGKEALGVKTWDLYDDVIGAFTDDMHKLLAIGGDEEIESLEKKDINRFKPVVKYLGPFYLESGKTAKHKVKMPQYVGSVKTMVIAAAENAYGNTETITPVKQPLMLLATLPRVAGPLEDLKLPVNIFLDDQMGNVELSVKVSGALKIVGESNKRIQVKDGSDIAFFDLRATEKTGPAKVTVSAKSGQHKANYDIDIAVMPRNPEIIDVSQKLLDPNQNWPYEYKPLGILGENHGTIEISVFPPINIDQRLNYLIQYPHGCIEQLTSAGFAQLFLEELVELEPKQKLDIQTNVNSAIFQISSFQKSNGGFSYWKNDFGINYWGSNYAGHFLIEAKDKGFAVSDKVLINYLRYQKEIANNWDRYYASDNGDLVQAYRLYVLARAGKPEIGAMNRMKSKTDLSPQAKWRLANAYAISGYKTIALELINNVSMPVQTNDYQHYTFGSDLRDEAMILETMIALDINTEAFEKLLNIAKKLSDPKKWMSTQTTAYCFISLSKYLNKFPKEEKTEVNLIVGSKTEVLNGNKFVQSFKIQNPDLTTTFKVENKGAKPVFVRLIRRGKPIEGFDIAAENKIKMNVNYTDRAGNNIDISKLKQGTNFEAIVTITNPGFNVDFNELALTQIFPSGWEIVNTRLDDSSSPVKLNVDYTDIRDDRVMNYFDLNRNSKITFQIILQAAYQGRFYLPATQLEAMYDNSIYANTKGQWVEVLAD